MDVVSATIEAMARRGFSPNPTGRTLDSSLADEKKSREGQADLAVIEPGQPTHVLW